MTNYTLSDHFYLNLLVAVWSVAITVFMDQKLKDYILLRKIASERVLELKSLARITSAYSTASDYNIENKCDKKIIFLGL